MEANQDGPENQGYGPAHTGVHTQHPASLMGVWPTRVPVPTLTDNTRVGSNEDVMMGYQHGTERVPVSTLTSKQLKADTRLANWQLQTARLEMTGDLTVNR